jgi:hypothetical protein
MEDFLKTPCIVTTRTTTNQVFANHSKEEEIFPLTTPEIVEAQKADIKLKHCFERNAD